jgi:hypothetical protein
MWPMRQTKPPAYASAALRAWRGEISLYRAAYALGGLGLAIAALLGDAAIAVTGAMGGATGWICWLSVNAGELLFVWVATVATWRSARRGRPDGRRYGLISVGLALFFVGAQLALTIGWTGWTAGAALGLAPEPAVVALDWLIRSDTDGSAWITRGIKVGRSTARHWSAGAGDDRL